MQICRVLSWIWAAGGASSGSALKLPRGTEAALFGRRVPSVMPDVQLVYLGSTAIRHPPERGSTDAITPCGDSEGAFTWAIHPDRAVLEIPHSVARARAKPQVSDPDGYSAPTSLTRGSRALRPVASSTYLSFFMTRPPSGLAYPGR